jgi:hypothetical protein
MASIAKRPDGQWRARYRDEAGKEHAKHFLRKVDAQRWLDEVTAAVVTGQYVNPKAGRVTFSQYAEQWRSGQVIVRAPRHTLSASYATMPIRCSVIGRCHRSSRVMRRHGSGC